MLAWPLKLYSLIETNLLVKMSDFYEEVTDTVKIKVVESFGREKKAAQEILEAVRGVMSFLSRLIFVPLLQTHQGL